MKDVFQVSDEELEEFYQQVKKDAEAAGYHLNKDVEFTKNLLKSIIINKRRYGYGACPCRLASGDQKDDLDIVCPCDYRDSDLNEYGACYCGLYVSGEILSGEKKLTSIPERRPPPEEREKLRAKSVNQISSTVSMPVWRCTVCGYLCARQEPPEICPICRVSQERFERFM